MKKSLMIGLVSLGVASGVLFADTYTIDPSHSEVGFSIKHLGVSNVRGEFSDFEGIFEWDGDKKLDDASLNGKIQVNSIDTQNEKRDGHLKGADFFESETFPEITFKSKKVYKKFRQHYIEGELTLHGVSKVVKIPVTVNGPVQDPWGNTRLGVEGQLTIDRSDYELSWNKTLDKGGFLIGNDVVINVSFEAIKSK